MSNMKESEVTMRESMLILMTLLPEDKQCHFLKKMVLKSSPEGVTNDIEALRDIESDGARHHHEKKNVSLTRYFEYCLLIPRLSQNILHTYLSVFTT